MLNPTKHSTWAITVMIVASLGLYASGALAQTAVLEIFDSLGPVYNPIISQDGTTIAVSDTPGGGTIIQDGGAVVPLGGGLYILAMSADGGTLIIGPDPDTGTMIWRDGIVEPLPVAPSPYTSLTASALSADGQWIAGRVYQGTVRLWVFRANLLTGDVEVFPWSATSPFLLGSVQGISGDGSTIIGAGQNLFGNVEAMAQNAQGVRFLGIDGTVPVPISSATEVSFDGSVIAGSSDDAFGTPTPVWWEGSIMRSLGLLRRITAISGDGTRIVGFGCFFPPGCGNPFAPPLGFYWTRRIGVRNVNQVLQAEYGLDLRDFRLNRIDDLSDDGLVLIGQGGPVPRDPSTQRLFRVTLDQPIEVALPEPAFGSQLALGMFFACVLARADRMRSTRR